MLTVHFRIIMLMALLAAGPVAVWGAGSISAQELTDRLENGEAPLILDVRTPEEYRSGHVPGARNIPHTRLASRLSELPGDRQREVIVYCEIGGRAAVAEGILEEAGFTWVRGLDGHMRSWRGNGYPQE